MGCAAMSSEGIVHRCTGVFFPSCDRVWGAEGKPVLSRFKWRRVDTPGIGVFCDIPNYVGLENMYMLL